MTAVLDPDADEVYVVSVEPHRRSAAGRWLCGALDLWCAMTGGTLELTRRADVVVRRRSDGVAELRIATRSAVDAGPLVEQVRDQLATSTPEEFRATFGIA